MVKHASLVCQYLEKVSWKMLEDVHYQDSLWKYIAKKHGVYALYSKNELYYVGLASNFQSRLSNHLQDRHREAWDRFSVYITVSDRHIKEMESLILRIVAPPGNRQSGKFGKAENLLSRLKQDLLRKDRRKHDDFLDVREKKMPAEPVHAPPIKHTERLPVLSEYASSSFQIRARRNGKTFTARVAKDGTIHVKGKTYSSPSLAAKALTRGSPRNGWTFWSYERAPGDWVYLDELRNRNSRKKPRQKDKGRTGVRTRKSTARSVPAPPTNRTERLPALSKYVSSSFQIQTRYKGKTVMARVVNDGTIRFQGKTHQSPSLAAKAVTKGSRRNGWKFWNYERAPGDWVSLNELRK